MADCSIFRSDPAVENTVYRYESWLSAQSHRYPGVGTPKSPKDVEFLTDRQAAPESGLSKVHLKNTPAENISYVYARQLNRLVNAVFSDGLAAVPVPVGRWAYIDESGQFAYAPIFHRANDFDHGVATAQLGPDAGERTTIPEGTWVLLDKSGAMKALDPSITEIRQFSNGLAAFSNGQRLSGYVDSSGAIKIPATFVTARPFCTDKLAPVRTSGGWGLINEQADFVVPAKYDDIHCFSEEVAAVKAGGKWGFIGKDGAFTISPRFDGVGDFSEGFSSFERRNWVNGTDFPPVSTYGFVDRTGSVVVQPSYSSVYPFKLGIAKVGIRKVSWVIYPLMYVVPADPHYTFWRYINQHGDVVASDWNSWQL
jgi:hypothetical protein